MRSSKVNCRNKFGLEALEQFRRELWLRGDRLGEGTLKRSRRLPSSIDGKLAQEPFAVIRDDCDRVPRTGSDLPDIAPPHRW